MLWADNAPRNREGKLLEINFVCFFGSGRGDKFRPVLNDGTKDLKKHN